MSSYDHYVTIHCPAAWDRGWMDAVIDPDIDANICVPDEFEDAESHYLAGVEQGIRERAGMPPDQIDAIREAARAGVTPFPRVYALN